ncbi:MAG: ATP-dependent DNA helicase RecG [Gammaproteobacteria bacterium CG11_big_fil_rev_8_21_14_0_20_46_22]|nr:MAG: ATP-dependent DNA helicase RecG [Gammaproteobacteria bacterium CG12_big_fil_rev_8_21_14_0_65_46_12]PIR10440.1 MAG: ATP-dependent DNA helicase RecG [Gammaproteobacteria bacterium CG11_big_fil_rev_8_21_14_0_20_46_22]
MSGRLWQQPLRQFKGVGDALAKRFAQHGLHTYWDLLLELPLRYQDRTRVSAISRLQDQNFALVRGKVTHAEVSGFRKKMFLVYIADASGQMLLRFFRFYPSQVQQFQVGSYVQCVGDVKRVGFQFEMIHPEYQFFDPDAPPELFKSLTPLYSSHKGVPANLLRQLIESVVLSLPESDELPETFRSAYGLGDLYDLFRQAHKPLVGIDKASCDRLRYRLAFEELLAHQLTLNSWRAEYQAFPAKAYAPDESMQKAFLSQLAFSLTAAQQRVLTEIHGDLLRECAMMRLVQGDVGSGKTVVAALSALPVLAAGDQVALMAPTEILAEQHVQKFQVWFEALGYRVAFLASKLTAKHKREQLAAIELGEVDWVIGTHALFQDSVAFKSLGLVIIDEQHRFGVHQRLLLRDKGAREGRVPHQLIMTATPIPRTLAMCAYADLDQSIIDELPPGRKPIKTVVLDEQKRDELVVRIRSIVERGRQVYWVCTLIEASEVLECQAAQDRFVALSESLPDLRLALLHGRMKPAEKANIMADFVRGEVDVLVATSVIEVGVDVPNACLMIIENAERLGLSQLHQLRGRIGRGAHESFCVLLYKAPLGKIAKSRLRVMRETQDGFKVAEEDLKLRGPGEMLGTRQAGEVGFRFADIETHEDLLSDMPLIASRLDSDSAALLLDRWQSDKAKYASV